MTRWKSRREMLDEEDQTYEQYQNFAETRHMLQNCAECAELYRSAREAQRDHRARGRPLHDTIGNTDTSRVTRLSGRPRCANTLVTWRSWAPASAITARTGASRRCLEQKNGTTRGRLRTGSA